MPATKRQTRSTTRKRPAAKPTKTISVGLLPFGGRRRSYSLPEGSTVDHLLKEAKLSHKDGSTLVNAKAATGKTILKDSDEVIFAGKISGGR